MNRLTKDYFGFWYQKIARATRATVMIQSTMSLARFFSLGSAIVGIKHTRNCGSSVALISSRNHGAYGLAGAGVDPTFA